MRSSVVSMFGEQWLLFDLGGAVAIAGFLVAFIVAALQQRDRALPRGTAAAGLKLAIRHDFVFCGLGSSVLGRRYDPDVPILAAVDDLLFRSKIRTTAKHVGIEIVFAQTPDEMLAQARALKPSLVIIDLNSPKADAVNTIAALKADPDLAGISGDRIRVARSHRSDRRRARRRRGPGAAAIGVRRQPGRDPAGATAKPAP